MHSSLWGALLGLAIIASGDGPHSGGSLSQADMIAARAASSSPMVVEAEANLLAVEGRRAQVGGLAANPTVQIGVDLGGNRVGGQLSQPVSMSGQGRAQRQAADLGAEVAWLEIERARLEAATAARAAFAKACAAVEQRRIAAEGARLASQLATTTQTRAAAGDVPTLDAQLARLAEAQAHQALMAAVVEEASALQLLSEWAQEEIVASRLPADPLAAVPQPTTDQANPGERADLQAASLRIEGAEAEATAAQAQAVPPVSLRFFYEREMGQTFAGPGLSVPIPLFKRAQEAQGIAAGSGAVARAQHHALQGRIASERTTTADLHAQAQTALAIAKAAGDTTVSEVLAGIGQAYEAGEIDLAATLVLQQQALVGATSVVALKREAATASLSWLLAVEDPALLGGRTP